MNPGARTDEEDLADAFARHIEAWARAHGAEDSAVQVARQLAFETSLATSGGHVCLALAGHEAATQRRLLLASGVVGTPAAPAAKPLILDEDGRLYLHRYFDYERRLAQRLMRAATAAPVTVDAATCARLQALFAGNAVAPGAAGIDGQQLATALALRGRLTVISGGPGTGKTTTVVNLLACLLAQNPNCRIALAAPTGKAAARMTEALRARAAHLPPDLRQRLPTESSTVHRLLGVTPAPGGFVHHAGHRLAIDALVVDEASMLDLALATRLLEAVPETARIILLGDKDQLAAVESGAVFAEIGADPTLGTNCRDGLAAICGIDAQQIVTPAPARASVLQDSVVWLTHNFRFDADSALGQLAAHVNAARVAPALAALAALREGGDASVRWFDGDDAAAWQCLHDGYAPCFAALAAAPGDIDAFARAFAAFRALCAVREGPHGVQAVNERVTRQARHRLGALDAEPHSPWYPGRPVMVLRNDPALKLFNGDIGLTLPDAAAGGALRVFFPDVRGGWRAVAPLRLPAHQTAYAMTVHKAQGSEFDAVLLLLPAQGSRVLTRELLYTALTRARLRVALCAGAEVLASAMRNPTRRDSGLLTRLRESRDATHLPRAE